MGLFERIFGNRPKEPPDRDYEGMFKMLNGYTPHFTTWQGEIYESELVRAAINALATHISKLKVEMMGAARPALQNKMKHGPNEFQTWSQFLERAATIYYATNNLILTPIYDMYGEPSGVYAPLPSKCSIVEYEVEGKKVPFMRYYFGWSGGTAAIELEYVGVMPRMQFRSDFFGESNLALLPTMDLIKIQEQGIKEGVKNAASYRFMAQTTNFTKPADLKKERKRFSKMNLSADAEAGGILLFPNTYANIQQIKSSPFVVDADQMKQIRDNVNDYFGVNEDILTNHFSPDTWAAFYEGAIEPFAIKFSDTMTKMFFTLREQTNGNKVMATANRLQYMSNADKLNVATQLLDRGIISINDAREIWNMAPVEGGDQRIIRGEYYNADEKIDAGGQEEEDEQGN